MKAFILTPEGVRTEVHPKNGKDFKYEELCELLPYDCLCFVTLSDGRWLIGDDNGIANGLKLNHQATHLYLKNRLTPEENNRRLREQFPGIEIVDLTAGKPWPGVVGTVLICESQMIE